MRPAPLREDADDFHYSNGFVIGGSARVLSAIDSYVTIRQGLEESTLAAKGLLKIKYVETTRICPRPSAVPTRSSRADGPTRRRRSTRRASR